LVLFGFLIFVFPLTQFSLLPAGWHTEASVEPVVALAVLLTTRKLGRGWPMVLGEDGQEGLSLTFTHEA